jgi:hypothetical protein
MREGWREGQGQVEAVSRVDHAERCRVGVGGEGGT